VNITHLLIFKISIEEDSPNEKGSTSDTGQPAVVDLALVISVRWCCTLRPSASNKNPIPLKKMRSCLGILNYSNGRSGRSRVSASFSSRER
jgi:hypothetical protein